MRLRLRRSLSTAAALLALAACTFGDGSDARDRQATNDRCYALGWERCADEPYPYRTPLPPAVRTPIDGVYTRTITERLAWLPGKCRRCPPYRMLEGEQTLTFDSGRFFVFHPADGYRVSGHAEVGEGRIRLYNDPNCIGVDGVYRWSLSGDLLTFEVIRDTCPYTGLRRRYFTAQPWALRGEVIDERCIPPNEEAAVTGHWAIPPHCLDPEGGNG